jgi:hypothetical protein
VDKKRVDEVTVWAKFGHPWTLALKMTQSLNLETASSCSSSSASRSVDRKHYKVFVHHLAPFSTLEFRLDCSCDIDPEVRLSVNRLERCLYAWRILTYTSSFLAFRATKSLALSIIAVHADLVIIFSHCLDTLLSHPLVRCSVLLRDDRFLHAPYRNCHLL